MGRNFSGLPFRFDIPITVFKKADDGDKAWRIGGVMSTEHPDREQEVVLQRGLKLDDFLKNGWFNDNHSKDTTGIVGYPETVKRIMHKGKPATYVEGYLIKDYDRAKEIYKLARALQKTNRRLGFSVEGKILRRTGSDGKTIAEALVRNVAITNCPVNDNTDMELLAKSMMAVERADPSELEKMLMAGSAVTAPTVATPGDGFALRTESLESNVSRIAGPTRKKKKKNKTKAETKNKQLGLTKSEAVAWIKGRCPQIQDPRIIDRILQAAKKHREK
jgi:hypothetical protein